MAKGAPKGHPKWGGRKPGSLNAMARTALELCAEYNFNPIQTMIEIAMDMENETALRLHAAKEVAQYIMPKLSAMAVSATVTNPYLSKSEKELEILVQEKLTQ